MVSMFIKYALIGYFRIGLRLGLVLSSPPQYGAQQTVNVPRLTSHNRLLGYKHRQAEVTEGSWRRRLTETGSAMFALVDDAGRSRRPQGSSLQATGAQSFTI